MIMVGAGGMSMGALGPLALLGAAILVVFLVVLVVRSMADALWRALRERRARHRS